MKALTVQQPWAWAIIHGGKDIENRTWSTPYRGPLAIHAGQTWSPGGGTSLLVQRALERVGREVAYPTYEAKGVVLGVVDLVDVVEGHDSLWAQDGLLHWVLANPRPLITPLPAKGRLSLWDVPDVDLRLNGYTDQAGAHR